MFYTAIAMSMKMCMQCAKFEHCLYEIKLFLFQYSVPCGDISNTCEKNKKKAKKVLFHGLVCNALINIVYICVCVYL